MPKRQQNQQIPAEIAKVKLRTASEVISRLKWSGDDAASTSSNTIMGYDCRINGPMEKCVADFRGIQDGGDIPEHRIQYFRKASIPVSILWDRISRVDRLFGSGVGENAPDSPETLSNVEKAMATMARLDEERAIRAQEKAKRKARQQAKKAQFIKRQNKNLEGSASGYSDDELQNQLAGSLQRHLWKSQHHYSEFDKGTSKWIKVEVETAPESFKGCSEAQPLKMITWNILFDLHRSSNTDFEIHDITLLNSHDTTEKRWDALISSLAREDADVIALQEVTPRFVSQLESAPWVRDNYCMSASSIDANVISPYGNLILWKGSSGSPSGLYLCLDGQRKRATVLALQRNTSLFLNVANIHLPADKQDQVHRRTMDRSAARSREMSAIIGKLQLLEAEQSQHQANSIPFILGDCNTGAEHTSIVPKDYFVDTWLLSDQKDSPGFTFDWQENPRAAKTHSFGHSDHPPRRIDRIFMGGSTDIKHEFQGTISATLLSEPGKGSTPPSDHYGIALSLPSLPKKASLCSRDEIDRNAWSNSTMPTTQSILALVFDRNDVPECEFVRLFDPKSSLPQAHVTLLNGFVDLSSPETRALALEAVMDTIAQSATAQEDLSITIDPEAFTIFEHANSATLVYKVDTMLPQNAWLQRLYETLRIKFPLCHEQESRFESGWTPHCTFSHSPLDTDALTFSNPTNNNAVSIGSFSSTTEAREKLVNIRAHCGKPVSKVYAFGLGLFARDATDGKFYTTKTIPFQPQRLKPLNKQQDIAGFVADGGISLAHAARGATSVVLNEIDRGCKYVLNDLTHGDVELSIHPYGSAALGSYLPGLSDLDLVIKATTTASSPTGNVYSWSCSEFFQSLASRLRALHPSAKTRMRVASQGSSAALCILTVRLLGALYPPVDILLARFDRQGQPVEETSSIAWQAVEDTQKVLETIETLPTSLPLPVFQGALRLIKLWADKSQIYGKSTGFLGGAGWATLLAVVLQERSFVRDASQTIAAEQVALHFFKHISELLDNKCIFCIDESSLDPERVESVRELANARGTIAVLAPVSGGNFGQSGTPSTVRAMKHEIMKVKKHLREKLTLTECLQLSSGVEMSSLVLTAEIPRHTHHNSKPAEVKAWISRTFLNAIVSMERRVGASSLRPYSNIEKHGASFHCRIGFEAGVDVSPFVDKLNLEMESDPHRQYLGITSKAHVEL